MERKILQKEQKKRGPQGVKDEFNYMKVSEEEKISLYQVCSSFPTPFTQYV